MTLLSTTGGLYIVCLIISPLFFHEYLSKFKKTNQVTLYSSQYFFYDSFIIKFIRTLFHIGQQSSSILTETAGYCWNTFPYQIFADFPQNMRFNFCVFFIIFACVYARENKNRFCSPKVCHAET